ncbi:WD40-repeat-containing domain protein [Xylariaceae sp. FL0594]|nr:WD40-repeat-containing domain protein [Xylariaceae sp. FL0594]
MSVKLDKILAPAPVTRKAQPTPLSADPKGERIAYPSGKSIFLRSIDDPSDSIQYTGHLGNTTVARFSPISIKDVYKVVSGDDKRNVRVWEWIKGPPDEFKQMKGGDDSNFPGQWQVGTGRINDVAIGPDGNKVVAVGTGSRAFRADGGNAGQISGHAGEINTLAIRPTKSTDPKWTTVTGGVDRAVVYSGKVPLGLLGKQDNLHEKEIQCAAISPDGSKLVTVGSDSRIQYYEYDPTHLSPSAQTGNAAGSATTKPAYIHKKTISQAGDGIGHKTTITAVSWAADSKRFATTGAADFAVKVWDAESGKVLRSWTFDGEGGEDHGHQQVGVVWPPNRSDDLIISLSLNGNLNYLEPDSETPVRVVQGQQKMISAMAVVGGKTLYTGGGFDGKVYAYDAASGNATRVGGDRHTSKIVGFACTDDKVYSVAHNNKLRPIDIATQKFTGDVVELPSEPRGVAAANGRIYIALADRVAIYVGGKEVAEITTKQGEKVHTVAASGSLVAVGHDNRVRLYKVEEGNAATLVSESDKAISSEVSALAFSRDGSRLAVGMQRGAVIGFDTSSGTLEGLVDRWIGHTARVWCLAWNEQGTHVVSGSLDTHMYIYSFVNPRQPRSERSNAHKEGVYGVAWVGDDKLASAGSDGCVKIWEWTGGK